MNEPQLSSWMGLHGVALSAAHTHEGGRSAREGLSWAMGLAEVGDAQWDWGCGRVQRPVTLAVSVDWYLRLGLGQGSPPQIQWGLFPLRPMAGTTGLPGLLSWLGPPPCCSQAPSHLWNWVADTGFPPCPKTTWLLGRCFLEEVRDPLNQEITVFQVGEQEGHFAPGANRQRAGQDTGTVGFFDNGHLGK